MLLLKLPEQSSSTGEIDPNVLIWYGGAGKDPSENPVRRLRVTVLLLHPMLAILYRPILEVVEMR